MAVAHYLTGGYLRLPSQAHPPLVAAVSNAMDQFYSCALTVVRTHSVQCACGESTVGAPGMVVGTANVVTSYSWQHPLLSMESRTGSRKMGGKEEKEH